MQGLLRLINCWNYRNIDKIYFIIDFNDYHAPKSIIFLCSWSLPSLLKLSEANRNTKPEPREALRDSQLRHHLPLLVEDGDVRGMVCFSDRSTGCQYSKNIFVKKMWILLHLQFFSATKLWFALLWYGLNVEQKIQEIRRLIDPQVHVLQGFCFYGFYTIMMSC